ncbi:MAG: PocR ligand-binding domain-containing protein [Clostridia bacterium]|nr:PocR ligand-binding domain-containing protein [Clostridia bacterium]
MSNKRAEDLIRHFYQISGMEVVVQNTSFRTVTSKRSLPGNLCTMIHRAPICLDMCRASDKERFALAGESREPLIYICPFGMTKTHIPIMKNDEKLGYIFCSMGIVDGDDEAIAHHILSIAPTLSYKEVLREVGGMPHLSSEDFRAYHAILTLIAEEIARSNLFEDALPSIARQTKDYIRTHLADKITLADLSWHLHCSTVTITEHFRKEFGITVMEYVMKKRMAQAEKLLRETNQSVKEIALLCGFSDVEYFSRCFKKEHGCPPGEWKKANEGKPESEPEIKTAVIAPPEFSPDIDCC